MSILPVEFVVMGCPVSHQSHNRPLLRAWQETVRNAARAVLPADSEPVAMACRLTVVFVSPNAQGRGKLINLEMPIGDALSGLIYVDDACVSELVLHLFQPAELEQIPHLSPLIRDSLKQAKEFVFIRVKELTPEDLETVGVFH